jgi:hypothetical protein
MYPLIIISVLFTAIASFCFVSSGLTASCPCLAGKNNYCQYGPSYPGCGMTSPGGYCDPNGDGSFSDADWVRGYNEYQANCDDTGNNLPDVQIEDLWWTPSDPAPGAAVQLHVRVRNIGNAGTGADVGVGYFVDGHQIGWGIRGPMAAGETSSNFGMHQRWTATNGTHQIRAVVDDVNRFDESNENNNARQEVLTVGNSNLPDVYIEDMWWTPAAPGPGESVQLHVRVHNSGSAGTGADVGVGYFVDGHQIGWGIRGPMAAGETSSNFGMHQRWTATSGTHQIRSVVDDVNRFDESNENNNARQEVLTIGGSNSMTAGQPKGSFGTGGQTDNVTEPNNWRWSEWFYGHNGIDRIAWQKDACGNTHNYAMGWSGGDLIEYRMKFGGDYKKLILRGKADRPGPVNLAVYVDGQYKAAATWNNNNDCNQDAVVVIAGLSYGTHAIAVQFTNDYYSPPDDRNFYLDGLRVEPSSTGGNTIDLLPYLVPQNQNFRVHSRLRYPDGGTGDEVFAYRSGGLSNGLQRWYFVKNASGENWEEFGWDGQYIYRNRDSSWANTCQDGASAFYKVTDSDRSAFARWVPRNMKVGDTWSSPVTHFVDAGYKRSNNCRTDTCSSPYEGWVTNRMKLVAHHGTYTTIWGYSVPDVIELTDPYNAESDHFFYARGYGLVGFEGPAGNNEGRFRSGAYHIDNNAGGAPNWVGLCD